MYTVEKPPLKTLHKDWSEILSIDSLEDLLAGITSSLYCGEQLSTIVGETIPEDDSQRKEGNF